MRWFNTADRWMVFPNKQESMAKHNADTGNNYKDGFKSAKYIYIHNAADPSRQAYIEPTKWDLYIR
jgi:hypothetical protein